MEAADEITDAKPGSGRSDDPLRIEVVYSPRAGVVDVVPLRLPLGATLGQAINLCGLDVRHPGLDVHAAAVGVWGVASDRNTVLRDRDRVEIYRALTVDPKEARRRRKKLASRPTKTS